MVVVMIVVVVTVAVFVVVAKVEVATVVRTMEVLLWMVLPCFFKIPTLTCRISEPLSSVFPPEHYRRSIPPWWAARAS